MDEEKATTTCAFDGEQALGEVLKRIARVAKEASADDDFRIETLCRSALHLATGLAALGLRA